MGGVWGKRGEKVLEGGTVAERAGRTGEEKKKRADKARNETKSSGPGRVSFFLRKRGGAGGKPGINEKIVCF